MLDTGSLDEMRANEHLSSLLAVMAVLAVPVIVVVAIGRHGPGADGSRRRHDSSDTGSSVDSAGDRATVDAGHPHWSGDRPRGRHRAARRRQTVRRFARARGPPVTGTVVDSRGRPVVNALIRYGVGKRRWDVFCDENGHFEIAATPSRRTRIWADTFAPGFDRDDRETAVVDVSPPVSDLRIQLTPQD